MKKATLIIITISLLVLNANAQVSRSDFKQFNRNAVTVKPDMSKQVNLANVVKKLDGQLVKYGVQTNMEKVSGIVAADTLMALYNRPAGTYIPSLIGNADPQYLGGTYIYPGYFGSAFSHPWKFRNLSTDNTSNVWSWGGISNYSTDADASLLIDSVDTFLYSNVYYAPVLRAVNGTDTAIYKVSAANMDTAALYCSMGAMYVGNSDFYAFASDKQTGNYSIFCPLANGTSLDGNGNGYFWGTCWRFGDGDNGTYVNAIYSIYEKPMSPMTIKDICYFGYSEDSIPVPLNKSLTATILKINAQGQITNDTIASSTISGSDVIVGTNKDIYLPFTFYTVDPATGRQAPMNVVINDPFVIVLSGLQQQGMDFGLLSDYNNRIENTSYFGKVDALTGVEDSSLYCSSTNMNIDLTMDAYFNYMYNDGNSNTLYAPAGGGSAVDSVKGQPGAIFYTYFYSTTDSITGDNLIWVDSSTLPSWLTVTVDDSYYKEYGALVFDFVAQALPAGVSERIANVTLQSYGADATVKIIQNINTAVTQIKASKVKVLRTSNGFTIQYPSNYTSMQMYNVSGQIVKDYTLSGSGSLFIPTAADLTPEVYLLHFTGNGSETVKVVR